MKPSIFGTILILYVAFVFVINASKLKKRGDDPCQIKIISPDYGTIVHHGSTQRAIWKVYPCSLSSLTVDTVVRVIIVAGSNSTDTWIKVFDETTKFGAGGMDFTV
ncbi:6401_t:CDS:2, partial [Scutellospora calospora]